MATSEKTISSLISSQLPGFVRADYPKFIKFLESYYEWLEDETKGNTVYHIMSSDKYRDIDETLDPFIRIFKNELLPYFPEKTELDLVKILKGAREFYSKKGSEESLKWLFRVLFDQEIEVYYPKQQILVASDGKWKLPKAFNLTLTGSNINIDPNLLEKHTGTGSESTATCVVESANKTIDRNFGNEILEIYVSNVVKEFINGEQLVIKYVDTNGVTQTFSEKIIGAISNIRLDTNIRTDPQQRKRGLLYNVGDPVIVFGGLDATSEATDAVAYVGNVSSGSIEGVIPTFPGYGYRLYSNTIATVYRTPEDDPNANSRTDIRIAGLNEVSLATDSQASFRESIIVDKIPILYLADIVIGDGGDDEPYTVFSQNNRNIVIQITEVDSTDPYYNYEPIYANGASYLTANFKAKIATTNSDVGFDQGGSACTDVIVMYDVQLSNATMNLNFDTTNVRMVLTDLSAGGLICANSGKTFTYDDQSDSHSDLISTDLVANANSLLLQAFATEEIQTGGIALYNVLEGGFGFRSTPTINVTSYYDTFLSAAQAEGDPNYLANTLYQIYRQPIGVYGKIAHVYINNPGDGYANGDSIIISGSGYDFVGYVTVNSIGSIIRTTITNRGEGYFGSKNVSITTSGGANASLTAYGFGEGVENSVETGAIGRIRDIRVVSRGFDYISTPVVSLKVVDMMITAPTSGSLSEGDIVFQGSALDSAIFQGTVKSYNSSTGKLRLFNYSGNSFSNFNSSLPFTKNGTTSTFSIDATKKVPAPDQYPFEIRTEGLPNPYFYGNGKARAIAEFFNGLIQYPGFYVNTDGFLSADKKTQDSKIYHNYSYIIESEKSIGEYRNTVRDIVHPVGTSMLSRFVSTNSLEKTIRSNNVIYTVQGSRVNSNLQIADATSNVVTGNNTLWEAANNLIEVEDMIVVQDSIHPLRSQAKIVTVVSSNTEIETASDFTYIGQGKVSATTNFVDLAGTVLINPAVSGDVEINSPISTTARVNRSSNAVWSGTGGADFLNELSVGDIITINNQTRAVTIIANASYLEVNSVMRFTGTDETIYPSRNTVTGTSTFFNTELTVGDIITINNEIRKVENIISDTSLNVNSNFIHYATNQSLYNANSTVLGTSTDFTPEITPGDFIRVNNQVKQVVTRTGDTLLTVNSAFTYHGSGNVIARLANTAYKVSGNVNTVVQFIANGDIVRLNIATANLLMAQTGTAQVFTTNTKVVGSGSSFDTELAANDTIMINNQIRKVVNIASATVMNVNLSFSSNVSGENVFKLATVVDANINVTGNTLTTNVAINANLINLVYKVIPDYSTRDYAYKIITVTD